ncbi:MAG: hypothetical protein ACR2FN_08260 [Chitinophagaceae bacterium]
MKKLTNKLIAIFLILIIFSLSSCQAISDIFRAGMWWGIILVIIVIIIIIWIISKISGGGKNT